MPTYEYICDACQHEFEKFQSMTAEPVKVCPECKKRKVRRKISSGAGILFKGGGFYETDYRSKGYSEAAKKDADAAKPVEAKTESKASDSKPAEPAPAPKAEKPAKGSKSDTKKKH